MDFQFDYWSRKYISNLVEYANNPNIARYLRDAFPNPYTYEEAEKFIHQCENAEMDKAIIYAIIIDGAAVGSIGAFKKDDVYKKTAEIGYWLATDYWGRGIITDAVGKLVNEVFQRLDVVRLEAGVFAGNNASCRVLEKNGFTLEGVLRKSIFKNGALLDGFMYSLLVK